jgi:PHD/YefM family antitoxin component YafN of YafNO toxin-antitoxin module
MLKLRTLLSTYICTKGAIMTLPIVKATNVTTFRNSLKKQLDIVSTDNVALIVTRGEDKNVVVLSELEYETMIKSINNLKYSLKLLKSALEAENRDLIKQTLESLETSV